MPLRERMSWKRVLIGGEVTVLVALGAVGLHLAVRPHNAPNPPPALFVPTPALEPGPTPVAASATPLPSARPSPAPRAVPSARTPSPGWLAELGREDRRQLVAQWDVLRRLITAIERYLEERVIPELDRRR